MVSVTDPPAPSDAVARSETNAPAGAVNAALNWPAPVCVTFAGDQVLPPSADASSVTPVTAGAAASGRCPAVRSIVGGPAGVVPARLIPASWEASGISGCPAHPRFGP